MQSAMEDSSHLSRFDREEDMETEYLQDASVSCNSLSSSRDSSSGSVSVPSFGLDQSIQLQRSQGFQVVTSQGQETYGNATYMIPVIKSETNSSIQAFLPTVPQPTASFPMMQSVVQMTSNSEMFVNKGDNSFGRAFILPTPLNHGDSVSRLGNQSVFVSNNAPAGGAVGSLSAGNQTGAIVGESTCSTGLADRQTEPGNSSSDERSSKCKTSPKPVVRKKSRSSSSLGSETGNIMGVERSPSRSDTGETMHWGEMGFKPSLLEEILAEKKRALMKTPEMIQFLQSQQERLARARHVSRDCELPESMNDAGSTSTTRDLGQTGV